MIGAGVRVTLLFAALFTFFQPFCYGLGFEIGLGGTEQFPSGNVAYKGNSLDLQSNLGYDKTIFLNGRAKFDLPLLFPNLYFTASLLRFEATGSKDVTFRFGDVAAFTANVPFTSSLKLDHYDTTFFYGIPFIKTATDGMLNVDVGLNIRILDFKAELNQTQTGLKESKSLAVPVPMGFLALQVQPLDPLTLDAEIKAIAYGKSRYYDIRGVVQYKVFPFVFVSTGFKTQNIKIDQSDVSTDMTFSGPILELGVKF